MNQQERDIIQGIFDRLRAAESQPRDVEAERFIADLQSRQPYAPYVLAQSVYALEQSVNGMSGQLDAANREIAELKARAQAPAPAQSGGFLSGIFGGGATAAARPSGPWGAPQPQQQQMQQQGSPWGSQPPQAAPARAGGGFLATAATAAVGVAGGMLAANAISSMMSGNKTQQTAEPSSGSLSNDHATGSDGNDAGYDNNDDGGGYGDDDGGWA